MPAPVASGWSGRRVGLAPTGKAPPCHGARGKRSFDHLVGASEDRGRDRQAECLGGLEIDDQLECGPLLDWQIRGMGTFENLAGVNARLASGASEARPIGNQAADRRDFTPWVDRRNGI